MIIILTYLMRVYDVGDGDVKVSITDLIMYNRTYILSPHSLGILRDTCIEANGNSGEWFNELISEYPMYKASEHYWPE